MTDGPQEWQHTEPVSVAFTDGPVTIGGRNWKITLKNGVTDGDIDDMLARITYANRKLDEVAYAHEDLPAYQEAYEEPPARRPVPQTGSAGSARSNVERIGRITVTGTLDDPIVELYSANTGLQYPVFRPKAKILIDALSKSYPDMSPAQLAFFRECGKSRTVLWDVEWSPSPKSPNPDRPWKDIVGITAVQEV